MIKQIDYIISGYHFPASAEDPNSFFKKDVATTSKPKKMWDRNRTSSLMMMIMCNINMQLNNRTVLTIS